MAKKINLLDAAIFVGLLLLLFLGWWRYRQRPPFSLPTINRQAVTELQIAYPNNILVKIVQKKHHWQIISPLATSSANLNYINSLLDIGENLAQADLISQNKDFTSYQASPSLQVVFAGPKQKITFTLGKTSAERGGTFIHYQNKILLVPVFFSPPASASAWWQK